MGKSSSAKYIHGANDKHIFITFSEFFLVQYWTFLLLIFLRKSSCCYLRVYQLKDRKTFDKTVYQQLLQDDASILKDDMLTSRNVVVKPDGDASLDMPMEEEAQFVAVVGLFRHPDMTNDTWRQVIKRSDLDPDNPRILEAGENHLTLQPFKDE